MLLFYASYMLASALGQWLAVNPNTTITLWPPNGFVIAVLLVNHPATWPWWLGLAAVGELTGNVLWFQNSALPTLGYIVANALEAAVAAWLLRRIMPQPVRFQTLIHVLAFLAIGVLFAPMIAATVGSAVGAASGKHEFITTWLNWWLGDATGVLVTAPLVMSVINAWRDPPAPSARDVAEAIGIAVAILGLGAWSFSDNLPYAYVLLPPLLWGAVRFEMRGASSAALLIVLIAAVTSAGVPEKEISGLGSYQYVMMQVFLMVAASSGLVVAAITRQHRMTLSALADVNRGLEARVSERTSQVRESEQRFRATFENAGVGVALVAVDGTFQRVNDSFARMVGYEARDLEGRSFHQITHPDDLKSNVEFWRSISEGRIDKYETTKRYIRKDGQIVWGQLVTSCVRGEDGTVDYLIKVIQDVTPRRLAEQALQTSESRYRSLVELLPAGMYACDAQGRITLFNSQAAQIWGREPPLGEDADRYCGSRKLRAEDGLAIPHDESPMASALRSGQSFRDKEATIEREDGRLVSVSVNIDPIRDGEGNILGAINVFLDITGRKQAEEQRRLLMGEVNHRAKNLLSLVQAIARQTAASGTPDFLERFGQRLRALAASQDVLVKSNWQSISLEDLVRSQMRAFSNVADRRLRIGGPRVLINAAAAQAIGMILHELATNASKYGSWSDDAGYVDINWKTSTPSEGGAGTFSMCWSESGGPPVTAPKSRGFGSTVIDSMIRTSLGGDVTLRYDRSGLSWTITCPSSRILEAGHAVTSERIQAGPHGGYAPP